MRAALAVDVGRELPNRALAALLSALPLMLGQGVGSELRHPLGVTMVGGLLLSQLLTLYTTPVVYLYLDRFSHWLKRRFSRKQAGLAEPATQAAAGD